MRQRKASNCAQVCVGGGASRPRKDMESSHSGRWGRQKRNKPTHSPLVQLADSLPKICQGPPTVSSQLLSSLPLKLLQTLLLDLSSTIPSSLQYLSAFSELIPQKAEGSHPVLVSPLKSLHHHRILYCQPNREGKSAHFCLCLWGNKIQFCLHS